MKPSDAHPKREDSAEAPRARHATLADAFVGFQLIALELADRAGYAHRREHDRRAWLAAVPVVIVNYVAFRAQLRFWQAHLDPFDALLVSAALESIAVYWSWMAHQALMADDSAFRAKLAAYGMALIIGVLNYSHYMLPGWRPTVAAVTFGMMSVISPWLWTAYSRRISRDDLIAKNLIDPHAVRLGITRWFWHAYRCIRVMHAATWIAESRPAEAIRLLYPAGHEAQTERKAEIKASAKRIMDREPGHENAAPQTPPSDPRAEERPLSTVAAVVGSASAEGLTAARNEAERELAASLIRAGHPLPGRNELGRDPKLAHLGSEATRRRAARRILTDAKAGLNGHDYGA